MYSAQKIRAELPSRAHPKLAVSFSSARLLLLLSFGPRITSAYPGRVCGTGEVDYLFVLIGFFMLFGYAVHVFLMLSYWLVLKYIKAPGPPRGPRGDGHGDGDQAARLRCLSDADPFFSVVALISRVSFNGSPHVVFSSCGCHVPALACRVRGVPSHPRHVQSFNGRRAHAQRWWPNGPEPTKRRDRWREQEGCRVGANPTLPLRHQPQTWLGVARGVCQDEQSSPKKTGEPPENLKGADPRNGGRQSKDWLSGPLRGTFLTLTGSSRSWRSTTDVLDFAHCMSEIAPGGIFVFYRSSR